MRRWLILFTCGLASIPSPAQIPDPGMMAAEISPTPSPVADRNSGSMATQATGIKLASSTPVPRVPSRDTASDNSGSTVTRPANPKVTPPDDSLPFLNRDDREIHDSTGLISVRPVSDVAEEMPACIQRVEYLRKHNDTILAIAYLREVITNGNILPQYRARSILELADCLSAENQKAESLCWLKIWMELYSTRPEFGAVSYRVGTLYMQMGLPDLARDAYYLTLAHTVNQGQVQNAEDLKQYTRLTEATLWGLAANEYQSGQWIRAAELFDRYRREAPTASALSLEKAAFLQADCYYQLKQTDNATSFYEETLKQHPFNPMAPQARLRLYHLYVLKNAPEKAQADLQSLAWTVRTVWPKEETYWQKQTAEVLLALNQKNASVLPPLLQEVSQLPPEGKTWQEALNHYDALAGYQPVTMQATTDGPINSIGKTEVQHGLPEEKDLLAIDRCLNQLLPPLRTASTQ